MKIGDKIKALRAKKDISQQDLAKEIGVSDQAISAWENNKKVPRMGSVEKLAAFFNVPKSYLIEDDIGMDKLVAPAIASAAGLVLGGPVLASVLGVLSAVGTLANTMDTHADKKVKEELPTPFLMTKDDDEKEVLQLYRMLPAEHKATVKLMMQSLLNSANMAQQNAPSEDRGSDSEHTKSRNPLIGRGSSEVR
jgi:DNA-binding XRE family transcriptional regulator